ncbi:hypothetical protein [Paractinoplanes hotanensis]|uniref:Glycosyltransferase RgtA/B/C/D-like domain-containing protein n=1 Tax=Paractinoplanes hotanensis TaxID=2906497 RepID=A0ABT0YEV7_9ACTN|nr:hypothetical protein [Actinoplanes hotanensis]MCM4084582.1 hypothetical protein [Actinoplanes hotanensis]
MTTQIHVLDHVTTRPGSGPSRSRLRLSGLIAAALAAIVAVGMSLWPALNNDVTYALGGIETAGRGGVSVWDVFIARPVAYRLLMALLGALVPDGASLSTAHLITHLGGDLLVAGVAVVLFLGLRRSLNARAGALVAAATGLALIVSPPWHFLEPDWVAALLAVLAVGAALAPRRLWLGAVLGGFAAFLAIAVKLATFPLAVLALLLVGVLDRRRAAWAGAAMLGLTVIWYAATKHFLPWETLWLADQANLVANSPIHHGIRWHDIHRLLVGLGDVTLLSPIVAVAPAAAAALVRRVAPGRPRWIATAIAVVAAGLVLASAYGQGEFFMYHFAAVPVLAAGVWAAAFALGPAARTPLLVSTVVVAAASFVLLRRPPEWRHDNVTAVTLTFAALAVVTAIVTWRNHGRAARPAPTAAGALALVAATVLAVLPHAPLAFSGYNYALGNERPDGTGYTALRERIGPDTPVIYLSFGSINYLLGNPTQCRYPSPQWLQRGTYVRPVRSTRSYADNFRCLTDDQQAQYLVWQPKWFSQTKSSAEVRTVLNDRFDCSLPARIPAPKELVVCPARK